MMDLLTFFVKYNCLFEHFPLFLTHLGKNNTLSYVFGVAFFFSKFVYKNKKMIRYFFLKYSILKLILLTSVP